MKTLKFFCIFSFIAFGVSCTNDFSKPNNLAGTTWKATDLSSSGLGNPETFDYQMLKFNTTTAVEGSQKYLKDAVETRTGNATYSISGNVITIAAATDGGGTMTGTIEGNKLNVLFETGNSIVFVKQ